MVQIFGWFSADAARASRRKRSRACESCATASGRNFKATKDRKSTRLNSSHLVISYAVFCLKKKNNNEEHIHSALTNGVIRCLSKTTPCEHMFNDIVVSTHASSQLLRVVASHY